MKLITIHLLCLLISYITCYQVTDQIDFERDCQTQRQVSDSSIVEVFAYPRAGVIPEISVCSAKFVAYPPDRKLRIYINEFFLGPGACGHKLKIYDGDPFQTDPKWELTCGAVLTTYTSATNQIILSFTKPSVDSSQLYKFNIKITTDRDDSTLYFDALKTPSNEHFDALKIPANHALQHRKRRESANIPSYTAPSTGTAAASGGGLTSGAIAGIAVGCVVGAVIIIAICIYALWRMLRKAEEKKRYGANEPPPVFVTSSLPLSNCGIAPGSSRRSFRLQSQLEFSDISKKSDKSLSNSDNFSKSKSSMSYENNGFTEEGTNMAAALLKDEKVQNDIKKEENRVEKDYLKRDKDTRGSYRKEQGNKNIVYPDVVDSARKRDKERQLNEGDAREQYLLKETTRSDSMKRTDRERDHRKERGDSVKRIEKDRDKHRDQEMNKYKSRENRDSENRERGKYTDRDERRHNTEKYENKSQKNYHRYKTESVHTDDSGGTYLSSASDRYRDKHERQARQHDRYGDRRYRDDQYEERQQRDKKHSERSSSQRRGRTESHRRNEDFDNREIEARLSRRDDPRRQRSHSSSRVRSSHNENVSDHDRYRDSYRERDGHEVESGLRRRGSSRSQSGRQRSKSSYR